MYTTVYFLHLALTTFDFAIIAHLIKQSILHALALLITTNQPVLLFFSIDKQTSSYVYHCLLLYLALITLDFALIPHLTCQSTLNQLSLPITNKPLSRNFFLFISKKREENRKGRDLASLYSLSTNLVLCYSLFMKRDEKKNLSAGERVSEGGSVDGRERGRRGEREWLREGQEPMNLEWTERFNLGEQEIPLL